MVMRRLTLTVPSRVNHNDLLHIYTNLVTRGLNADETRPYCNIMTITSACTFRVKFISRTQRERGEWKCRTWKVTHAVCFYRDLHQMVYRAAMASWNHITSVESQKGVIAAQRCSVENQKGAIAVQSVNSDLLVLNGTSLSCNSALLVLNGTSLNCNRAPFWLSADNNQG